MAEVLTVRGHHFGLYKELLQLGSAPDFVEMYIRGLEAQMDDPLVYAYALDIIGSSSEDMRVFRLRLGAALLGFLAAGQLDCVHLVATPDDFCHCCIRGKHCREYSDHKKDTAAIVRYGYWALLNGRVILPSRLGILTRAGDFQDYLRKS